MSDLKICRICLRTECKVYKYDRFQLKPYYEEVMALKMNDKDGLPHYFCYECATILHKFHKFKEKCYVGQNALKELHWRGGVTYAAVYEVNRLVKKLCSPLEILNVSKRVKTYCTKDDSETTESEPESIKDDDEKEVRIKDIINYVSEDSVMYQDDFTDPVGDNDVDNSVVSDEEKPKIGDVEESVPKSPTTVFVDVKKEVVVLKNEPIKERRKSFSEFGLKKLNPKFFKERTKFLSADNWHKSMLTEEEAVREFRKRVEDEKYKAADYKCEDCFKWFRKADILKRHKQLRHSESLGALECRFCHMRFKWDCTLRKHMRSHFTRYKCLRCELVCSVENTAIMHEDYHNGVIKKCVHCGEEFKHPSTYYTHLRTHRSEHVCTLCGSSFVSPLGLHMHRKVIHVNDEIESPDDDEEVNTFCDKCDIRFETRRAYEEHLFHSAMHCEGVEDEIDEISIPRKVLGKKLQAKITHGLKKRKSDDASFVGPVRKGRRKDRRLRKKPTTCHQCGKQFDTQAACMKHHLEAHPRTSFFAANQRHICEICGASLAPGSVAVHQNIHTREKVHPCETCGRTFHSSVGLKRHLVTHTGEKPFACNLCDKRFTQSNSMKLHYRTFHLKQPYPKRNRKKKTTDDDLNPPEPMETAVSSSEESNTSMPESEVLTLQKPIVRVANAPERPPDENMQYLTLT